MRWIKRILISIAIFVVALIVFGVAALLTRGYWQKNWAPADNGISLSSKWPVLKASDIAPNSAFDLLRRAADAESRITRPPDVYKELQRLHLEPWSDESFPALSKMLAESGEALALARSAATASNPQVPTYMSIADTFPYMMPVMHINELFVASAARKVAAGDFAGAYDDLATSISFAQILSRGGVLIHILVEMTSEVRSCCAMRLIALQHELPRDVATRAIDRLLNTARTIEPLAETFREEYRAVPTTVSMVFGPSKRSVFGIYPDEKSQAAENRLRRSMHNYAWIFGSTREQVTEDLTRVYKCLVRTAAEPYSASEVERLEEQVVPPMKPRDWILAHDPLGYMLARLTLPTFAPSITRHHRRIADINATAVVIALRQYEQSQHHPPDTLEQIVPTYLPQIPADPFDAKPFRYRVRPDGKWIVYSVGPNQVDEGGEKPKIDPRKPTDPGDLVFCECDPDVEKDRLKSARQH